MHLNRVLALIGFHTRGTNYREALLSGSGGFLGIYGIFLVSLWLLQPDIAILIVPSMGASAVLLFAAPHAPFSQPWNLIGGHAVSAVIGVACWKLLPDYALAAAASVGISITVMYLCHCVHPPGGATALAAVIGSDKLHALGYSYEFNPILLNAITILAVAILFNGLFKWRRYPSGRRSATHQTVNSEQPYSPIKHEDFVYALSQIDTIVDVNEQDLLKIYELATKRRVEANPGPK